jgi:hypothetical protein
MVSRFGVRSSSLPLAQHPNPGGSIHRGLHTFTSLLAISVRLERRIAFFLDNQKKLGISSSPQSQIHSTPCVPLHRTLGIISLLQSRYNRLSCCLRPSTSSTCSYFPLLNVLLCHFHYFDPVFCHAMHPCPWSRFGLSQD